MRALFDTCVVSSWLARDPRLHVGLRKVRADLAKKKASLLISSVTIQELEVFGHHTGTLEQLRGFLSAHFRIVPFDTECARHAARLAARVQRPMGGTKTEKAALTNVWHRDAAIAGTAHFHALDALVTSNEKDFARFTEHMSCELIVVAESA